MEEVLGVISFHYSFNVFMFIKMDVESYVKLDPSQDQIPDDLFTDGPTVYLSMDSFHKRKYSMYHKGSVVFQFGGTYEESILSIKLCIKVQMAILVKYMRFG